MDIRERVKEALEKQGIFPTEEEIASMEWTIGLCGRAAARKKLKLGKNQAIHHIEGNPLNNDPSNLQIVEIKR